jgi:hypothetical protein
MCPAFIGSVAVGIAGAGWVSWLTALVVKDVQEERRAS